MENNGNFTLGQLIGYQGETIAAKYLEQNGFKIIERNFKCKIGEIDIIALEISSKTLCFIEVKTRNRIDYGLPCQFVNSKKQRLIRDSSLIYIKHYPLIDIEQIRFDVFEVLILSAGVYIRYLTDAF